MDINLDEFEDLIAAAVKEGRPGDVARPCQEANPLALYQPYVDFQHAIERAEEAGNDYFIDVTFKSAIQFTAHLLLRAQYAGYRGGIREWDDMLSKHAEHVPSNLARVLEVIERAVCHLMELIKAHGAFQRGCEPGGAAGPKGKLKAPSRRKCCKQTSF